MDAHPPTPAADAAPLRVELQLLREPALRRPPGALQALERKDAALLTALALDGPQPRAMLAALLWPDAGASGARNSLRQRLYRLRQALQCDVVAGDEMLALAPHVHTDLADAHTAWQDSAQALTGELLGQLDYGDVPGLDTWVQAARDRWRRQRAEQLAAWAAEHERGHRIAQALPYAQRLVDDEPLQEHAHRRLMRLHYLRGDRGAALHAYEHCVAQLGRLLGARPSVETRDLANLIERSGALAQPAPAPRPVAILRPPRLVGRAVEWAVLQGLAAGPARALLVTGEAGMGKSRLLAEFCATQPQAQQFSARVGDNAVPYALLGRVLAGLVQAHGAPTAPGVRAELARLLPELGEMPAHAADPQRLRQAVAAALAQWSASASASSQGPWLLAIDDLHNADAATLELLPALTSEMHGPRWLLTARGTELPAPIAAWLDEAEGPSRPQRLELQPLDLPATRTLLADTELALDAQAWAAPLQLHTGGNPLFMLETLLSMLAQGGGLNAAPPTQLPVPADVRQLISQRLARLDAAALRLARVAALAGPDFSVELAARVLGVHLLDLPEPWSRLEEAGVLRGSGFAHDLVREATRASVPEAIAQPLHRLIATELSASGAAPARLAAHWAAAHAWPQAAVQWRTAAEAAMAASRPSEGLAAYEQAVACGQQAADATAARGELFTAWLGLGQAARVMDRPALVLQAHQQLHALARSPAEQALAHEDQARTADYAGDFDTALLHYSQAIDKAAAAGDSELGNRLRWRHAQLLVAQQGAATALAAMTPLRPWIESLADARVRRSSLLEYGVVLERADQRRAAWALQSSLVEESRQADDVETLVAATAQLAMTGLRLGLVDEAGHWLQQSMQARQRLGADVGVVSHTAVFLAPVHIARGRFADALALLEPMTTQLAATPDAPMAVALGGWLALLWTQLGQHARAHQALGPERDTSPLLSGARWRARAALAADGAPRRAVLAQALASVTGTPHNELCTVHQLGLDCHDADAAALARLQAAVLQCEAQEQLGLALHARMGVVRALQQLGRLDEAARGAHELLAQLRERAAYHLYRPELYLQAALALHAQGEDAAATAAAQQAWAWVQATVNEQVAPPFRDGFLQRNPVNAALARLLQVLGASA